MYKYEDIIWNMVNDPDKETRKISQLCKLCYYRSAVGGDALTISQCPCGAMILNESTNKDELCINCAKEKNMCRHCGKEMD